jgi:hypothetical protein
MDAMLPMNLLTTDITLPFATIDDISLKYNPKADIPTDISFKKYCQVYQSSIAIDVGDSKFFQQSLTNYNMYLLFDFKCNSDVANKATFNNPDYSTADFMNE